MAAEDGNLTRKTANLTPKAMQALELLVAQEFGANDTDAINRAIRVAADIVRASMRGGEVQVAYPDGTIKTLWLV